ncbi:MAG: ABC transporter substrate-binding protein [Campylobacteraceae bacterium]|nr:ABC transporter substrate-binding protein [Campylobacteraceae bacterium]
MKRIIVATTISIFASVSLVYAAPTDLYVGAYGGSTQKVLTQVIFPKFEKANNVKIHYSAGNSTGTLAKLLAQKGNPDLDFVIMDAGPMSQAVTLGLCQPIKKVIKEAPLYPVADFAGGKAVGLGIVATGLAYNKNYFKKMGWAKPTSWLDLTNSKYKGKLGFQPITNSYGLLTLLALNKIEGGTLSDVSKGMDLVKRTIKPIVKNYEGSSAKLSEEFQSGDVVLAPWGSGRAYSLSQTGFNVGFVYPKEKTVALLVSMCVVKNNNSTALSKKLVKYMLTPAVQSKLADVKAWSPVNKKVSIDPKMASFMPVGKNASKMMSFDWATINKHREKWTNTWVRQIEN